MRRSGIVFVLGGLFAVQLLTAASLNAADKIVVPKGIPNFGNTAIWEPAGPASDYVETVEADGIEDPLALYLVKFYRLKLDRRISGAALTLFWDDTQTPIYQIWGVEEEQYHALRTHPKNGFGQWEGPFKNAVLVPIPEIRYREGKPEVHAFLLRVCERSSYRILAEQVFRDPARVSRHPIWPKHGHPAAPVKRSA